MRWSTGCSKPCRLPSQGCSTEGRGQRAEGRGQRAEARRQRAEARGQRAEMLGGAIPGARFVDPAVLARIGNLELVARSVVDGFINGLHRAPYFGASVDFAEHRGYVPG